ncbi:MAG TPA: potassium transporter Kup, partial [Bacillota bacterium]|nr:potassium transporter Kup [Bacillota bacterium]
YGDIGTSPLYALRECFTGPHGVEPSPHHVLGVISLIVWVLTSIVSIKYIGFVLRANNRGEGGILALLALVQQGSPVTAKRRLGLLLLLGVFGAALLYGDGMITPAITVLGAVEGLEVATPLFKPWVLPIAVVVLVVLFSFQRHGTGRIGSVFGPVMMVWFVVLGLLGIRGIWHAPQILLALSPHHAVGFLLENTRQAFAVLGAVFLVVTGAEALYADMGHFGLNPIRRAWFAVAFPALLLNYFGQGALLLTHPAAVKNPFYLLAPDWAVYGLVLLATFAAVIASQALISGAYSLTMQAIQMGLLPRISIRHTSHATIGQIYIPQVNWVLMLACVGLVLSFESSSRLAGAYGIAVSLTMLITTILFYAAARWLWQWPVWLAALVCVFFFALELTFVAANSLKLLQGGWFPLAVGTLLCTAMMTWRTGRRVLRDRLSGNQLPFELFLQDLATNPIQRVPGTAVFLSGNPKGTPLALLHNLKHNKVLHQHIIILTIVTLDVPYVSEKDRLQVEHPREDIHRVIGRYGFMEQADVPQLLASGRSQNLSFDMQTTTFFLSRETIIPGHAHDMALWRRRLFSALSRNAQPVTAFFKLPANRVVELGMQVEL